MAPLVLGTSSLTASEGTGGAAGILNDERELFPPVWMYEPKILRNLKSHSLHCDCSWWNFDSVGCLHGKICQPDTIAVEYHSIPHSCLLCCDGHGCRRSTLQKSSRNAPHPEASTSS